MADHGLHVVALISGGKDSLFAIVHCLAQGHEVAALGNLRPPVGSSTGGGDDVVGHDESVDPSEDLDSFMYQTVGSGVIPLYQDALGIPLYREEIRGSTVNANVDYQPPGHEKGEVDETESLLSLLRRIRSEHPTVNAVSTGAILSNYQRTRLESVALRLDLVPLTYLWRYPSLPPSPNETTSLLADMAAVGQDARIIKCASAGMDATFLWENVTSPSVIGRLSRAMRRGGRQADPGAVLGEGGEFETLTLDGPSPLWKHRIVVDGPDRIVVNAGAGSFRLRIARARLAPRESGPSDGHAGWTRLRMPPLLDPPFAKLQDELREAEARPPDTNGVEPVLTRAPVSDPGPSWRSCQGKTILYVWNMISSKVIQGPEAQMSDIVERMRIYLQAHNRSTDDICFVNVHLRRMEDFLAVNRVYGKLFSSPLPSARVTVARGNGLPQNVEVLLSMVVRRRPDDGRTGLHVRSRSYWAPANIGPYSQAIALAIRDDDSPVSSPASSLVFMAGQVPLVPASMEPLHTVKAGEAAPRPSHFTHSAVLSLQHLWRVGKAMNVTCWAVGISFIAGTEHIVSRAWIAWKAWTSMNSHERAAALDEESQDDQVDLWADRYGPPSTMSFRPPDPGHRQSLDAERMDPQPRPESESPPVLAIQVDQLPRGCDIEWTGLGIANGSVTRTSFVDDERQTTIEECLFDGGDSGQFVIGEHVDRSDDLICDDIRRVLASEGVWPSTQRRTGNDRKRQITLVTIYTDRDLVAIGVSPNVELVRVRSVWGHEGRRLAAGIICRFESLD